MSGTWLQTCCGSLDQVVKIRRGEMSPGGGLSWGYFFDGGSLDFTPRGCSGDGQTCLPEHPAQSLTGEAAADRQGMFTMWWSS